MLDLIAQAGVLVGGILALFLAGSTNPRRRMQAGMVGMASEPCWLYTTATNGQWMIFALALVYCVAWWSIYRNNRNALAAGRM